MERGSKQFVKELLKRGYGHISNESAYSVLKGKKCLVGLNNAFYIGKDNTVLVHGDKFYTLRGIDISETFLDQIINTQPNKFWRDLR